MKRHPALIEISREHHTVLSLSNRIIKAPQENHLPEIIQKRPFILAHFNEEEVQFAEYWKHLPDDDLRRRFEDQHRNLRALLDRAEQKTVWEQLAHDLRDHVRFEERELFPAFEQYILNSEEST